MSKDNVDNDSKIEECNECGNFIRCFNENFLSGNLDDQLLDCGYIHADFIIDTIDDLIICINEMKVNYTDATRGVIDGLNLVRDWAMKVRDGNCEFLHGEVFDVDEEFKEQVRSACKESTLGYFTL